jgi:proteasome assembly chaperone (PAC2) family protein
MSFLKRGTAVVNNPLKFCGKPELRHPSLIVGWNGDISKIGTKITDYLNKKLKGELFCEIEPTEFFPFRGIVIEDDLIQFPESKFYTLPRDNLIVFKSDAPALEWYKFVNML